MDGRLVLNHHIEAFDGPIKLALAIQRRLEPRPRGHEPGFAGAGHLELLGAGGRAATHEEYAQIEGQTVLIGDRAARQRELLPDVEVHDAGRNDFDCPAIADEVVAKVVHARRELKLAPRMDGAALVGTRGQRLNTGDVHIGRGGVGIVRRPETGHSLELGIGLLVARNGDVGLDLGGVALVAERTPQNMALDIDLAAQLDGILDAVGDDVAPA